MNRTDALRDINRDTDLKEEILTRIAEDAGLAGRMAERLPSGDGSAGDTRVLERIATATLDVDAARALLEDPPPAPGDRGLEAIILLLGRPVLLVQHDDVDLAQAETDTWRTRLEQSRAVLRSAIRSVGRIEVENDPRLDWLGTGWVVDDDVVVTNRHVASEFARRAGDSFVFRSSVLGDVSARLDFSEELGGAASAEFSVAEVLHIEPDTGPDVAFLRIDWGSTAGGLRRPPVPLSADTSPGLSVAVIGYPAKDTRTTIPAEMDRIFGSVYDVKRLAPGEVTGVEEQDQVLTHDCTTLGGNSGSVVVDLESGHARALHFAGRERQRNFAVPASTVRDLLDRTLAGAGRRSGVPSVPTPRAAQGPVEPAVPSAEELVARTGYAPDFLGPMVPHPTLTPALQGLVAPVSGRDDGILDYFHYSVRQHRTRRLALYTVVNIDGKSSRNVRRARDRWALDPRVDPAFQAGEELYEDNPLDRGHLVRRLDPAWGDSFDAAESAALDTFFFTNCAPQHQQHNQKLWLGIEDHILGNAGVHDLRVTVFSGPVFRSTDRPYRGFLIPDDYWKVVAVLDDDTGRLSATGYMVSQRDLIKDLEFAFGAFETYQLPVTTIEEQTGLDFGDLRNSDPLGRVESRPVRRLTGLDEIVLA